MTSDFLPSGISWQLANVNLRSSLSRFVYHVELRRMEIQIYCFGTQMRKTLMVFVTSGNLYVIPRCMRILHMYVSRNLVWYDLIKRYLLSFAQMILGCNFWNVCYCFVNEKLRVNMLCA